MLVKTRQFDIQFNRDVTSLQVVNDSINFKGSYRLKNFGDIITDIDLSHHVFANEQLIQALRIWAKRIGGNFIFLALNCGMYKPFRPPWSVDKDGDCSYDPNKAKTWLQSIRKLIDSKVYDLLEQKLLGPKISIRNLIEVKQITRPYSEIVWSLDDLERGEKKYMGDVYTIPELMREGYHPIAKLIYNFEGEYCAIDLTLSDTRFRAELSPLHDYYLQDYYKIFKSYKWYIEFRYKQNFADAIRNIQKYTGLLSRIKLLEMIEKYKAPLDQTKLKQELQIQAEILKISLGSLPQYLSEQISSNAKNYITDFRHKLQSKYVDMVEKFELRAKEAEQGITQEELKRRLQLSRNCPFFTLNLPMFNKVFDLAKRALIAPKELLRCIDMVAQDKRVLSETVAKQLDIEGTLRLDRGLTDLSVYRGGELLFREPLTKINKMKIYVLTGQTEEQKVPQKVPYINPTNAVITITFGEVAENHAGMQKLGVLAKEGFSIQDLVKAKNTFEQYGVICELVDIPCPIECKNCEAAVLVVRQGVKLFANPVDLWNELADLDTDKKAKMRGVIKNKTARHNLCFDTVAQEPDYETGKGRVVGWDSVPLLSGIRNALPQFIGEKAKDLKAEGNYYYNLSICGIGYHGDSERRKVIALRLGASMPIYYRWYYKWERVGEPIKIELHDGDIYIMSEKAVGTDWKLKNTPTLRHATGARKYTD